MDKVAHHYHQLLTSLTQRLEQGERDIDALEADARRRLLASGDLTPIEVENVTRAVRRDLEEFTRSYDKSREQDDESVFLVSVRPAQY
ncbi:MAG: zinc ribbon-containing protein [Sodalis sp. (in: enterobacteria)]|uniref:zinc ribbon-containing protein n=1 Tax=Sodalis sp. (in: enterobacteria) TaxID=1898979 RepID=UPI0039E55A07